MIRIILGFLIVFGAAGTLDIDPNANLWVVAITAIFGLVLAFWGVKSVEENYHG